MDKKLWIGFALIALLAGASAFYGLGPMMAGVEGKEVVGGPFAQLSDGQRTELQTLMDSHMDSMRELRESGASKEEIVAEMDEMHSTMEQFFADNGIEFEMPLMGRGMGFMGGMHGRGMGGMGMGAGMMGMHGFADLSEEQRTALNEIMADCHARMEEVVGETSEN